MIKNTCDICQKEVEFGQTLVIGRVMSGVDVCVTCAKPVISFLTKHKLLENSGVKHLLLPED